jgi:hypothetical protein
MSSKVIPEINRNIGKIWLKDQEFTFKNQVFPIANRIIKYTLVLLTVIFLIIFIIAEKITIGLLNALIVSIVIVWIMSCIVTLYIFTCSHKRIDFDKLIIREIKLTLSVYNYLYLK